MKIIYLKENRPFADNTWNRAQQFFQWVCPLSYFWMLLLSKSQKLINLFFLQIKTYIKCMPLYSFISCPESANIVASYVNCWLWLHSNNELTKSPLNPGACFSVLTKISRNFFAVSGSDEHTVLYGGFITSLLNLSGQVLKWKAVKSHLFPLSLY